MAKEIKKRVGVTLRKAFARNHVHQPADSKQFLAGYLMNLEFSEQMMIEELRTFNFCRDLPGDRKDNEEKVE